LGNDVPAVADLAIEKEQRTSRCDGGKPTARRTFDVVDVAQILAQRVWCHLHPHMLVVVTPTDPARDESRPGSQRNRLATAHPELANLIACGTVNQRLTMRAESAGFSAALSGRSRSVR
jgi:hypothetical protein